MADPFNFIQARMLRALAGGLFHGVDMAIPPKQVVANLQHQFSLLKGSNKAKEVGTSLYALLIPLTPFFPLLPNALKKKRLDTLRQSRFDLFQDLARVRGIVHAGYYGHWLGETDADNADNPVLKQMDFTLPAARTRAPGEPQLVANHNRDLKPTHFVKTATIPAEIDVIVIGSGAGGGVAAASLTGHGHDVLVIEAGGWFPTGKITHEERAMTAQLFVDGAIQTTTDNDIVVFQGRCVGGGTVINNGICLRVKKDGATHPQAEDVLAKWAALGAPIDPDAFDASYAAIEARIVNPISKRCGRNNGPNLLNGWDAYKSSATDPRNTTAPAEWFLKNYGPSSPDPDARKPSGLDTECAYCGYCNTGCPYGRKQGTAQSFLVEACSDLDHPARILANAKVTRILWKPGVEDGKRVASGVAIEIDNGDGTTTAREIHASKGVVVAAGTLASSRILAASGVAGTGKGISLNIASPVPALMPEGTSVKAWDEDQMTTYVDRGDFLLESHFQPPMSMASLMPGWFDEHASRMRNYNRLVSAGVLFPADRRGEIVDGKLKFKLNRNIDLPLIRKALATLIKVHFANGAIEAYPPLARGGTITPDMDVDAFLAAAIEEPDDVSLSSSHPHGGNAINQDPNYGVVDTACRLHAATNVLVTDASVFPSCIRVNAQLTTMAMAHYATVHDPFPAVAPQADPAPEPSAPIRQTA